VAAGVLIGDGELLESRPRAGLGDLPSLAHGVLQYPAKIFA
jgi:hypothetical protein